MADSNLTRMVDDLNERQMNGDHNEDARDSSMTDDGVAQEIATNTDVVSEVQPATTTEQESPAAVNMSLDIVVATADSQLTNRAEETGFSMTQRPDFAVLPNARAAESTTFQDTEKTSTQSPVASKPLTEGLNPEPGPNAMLEESAHVQETGPLGNSRTITQTQQLEALPVQLANNEHGSAARIYINTKITPVLLEGMKWVVKNEPEKPLKWLSEFLAKRSADIEGA